jgi:AraC-like DNA-binding protein
MFFFLVSLYAFIQYTMLYSHSVVLIRIVFIHFAIPTYLIGPSLFLYIRSVITDQTNLTRRDLWHLLPMIIYIAMAIPYFLLPASYKTELAQQIAADFDSVINIRFFPLFIDPVKKFLFLSRPLLALAYLIWSLVVFIHYLKKNSDSALFSGQHFMKKWIFILLGSSFVLIISQIILLLESYEAHRVLLFYTLNTLQVLSGTGLIVLLVSPLFFPQILYGLPRIPETALIPKIQENNILMLTPAETVRQKTGFESGYMTTIQIKTDRFMEDLQPFLMEDCNLFYFSKITNLPPHHLSYYFKEIRKQSFNDFKNEWRVKHAKRLILDGKHNELTLEAVGMLSGFTSRNTFFRSFRKFEGITPGEFAATIKP